MFGFSAWIRYSINTYEHFRVDALPSPYLFVRDTYKPNLSAGVSQMPSHANQRIEPNGRNIQMKSQTPTVDFIFTVGWLAPVEMCMCVCVSIVCAVHFPPFTSVQCSPRFHCGFTDFSSIQIQLNQLMSVPALNSNWTTWLLCHGIGHFAIVRQFSWNRRLNGTRSPNHLRLAVAGASYAVIRYNLPVMPTPGRYHTAHFPVHSHWARESIRQPSLAQWNVVRFTGTKSERNQKKKKNHPNPFNDNSKSSERILCDNVFAYRTVSWVPDVPFHPLHLEIARTMSTCKHSKQSFWDSHTRFTRCAAVKCTKPKNRKFRVFRSRQRDSKRINTDRKKVNVKMKWKMVCLCSVLCCGALAMDEGSPPAKTVSNECQWPHVSLSTIFMDVVDIASK